MLVDGSTGSSSAPLELNDRLQSPNPVHVRASAAPMSAHVAGLHSGLFQRKSHQRRHPNIVQSTRLNAVANIHGLGEEKRITLRGLTVSTLRHRWKCLDGGTIEDRPLLNRAMAD